jgi:hypothetical protein
MLPSQFSLPPGTSGQYRFLLKMHYDIGGTTYTAMSWNGYPYFTYDVNLDCTTKMSPKSPLKKKENYRVDRNADPNNVKRDLVKSIQPVQQFKLSPNPTSGAFKITLNEGSENGTLQVIDLNGNAVYSEIFRDKQEINVNLGSQKEGMYIVKVISDKNEMYTQKLIKK